MLIIGEKINGMFKKIRAAIASKDKGIIQEMAKKQIECGAEVLDVNVGPASTDPLSDMAWLVETIREVTDIPLAIDTTKPEVMDKGLSLAGTGSFLNSVHCEEEKMSSLFPIAKKHQSKVIALTMSKSGVPPNAEARMELSAQLVAKAMEYGIDTSDLYIDAVILPVNLPDIHAPAVLETIRQVKIISDPPPKTILGLSNVSQGTKERALIDRTFLVMAVYAGLDSAILNPLDKDLINAMITAEMILGKNIYCDSFLDAYFKGRSR